MGIYCIKWPTYDHEGGRHRPKIVVLIVPGALGPKDGAKVLMEAQSAIRGRSIWRPLGAQDANKNDDFRVTSRCFMNKLKSEPLGLDLGRVLGAIWESKSDPTREQISKPVMCTKSFYLQYETMIFVLTY